jgi:hypothetical protein
VDSSKNCPIIFLEPQPSHMSSFAHAYVHANLELPTYAFSRPTPVGFESLGVRLAAKLA